MKNNGHKASMEATELYLLRSDAMIHFWSPESMETNKMQAEFANVDKMETEKDQLSTRVTDLNVEVKELNKKLSEAENLNSAMVAELQSAKDS